MSFNDLQALPKTMKGENFLSAMEDVDLIALERDSSLDKLRLDIQIAKNVLQSDTQTLDTISDLNSEMLNMALTYLQLRQYYYNENDGIDSLTFQRFLHYDKQYNKLCSNFGSLLIKNDIETRQTVIKSISYG